MAASTMLSIGDHVSFTLGLTEVGRKANFGQIRSMEHGRHGFEYKIVVPGDWVATVHHANITALPVLPEHTIGDRVTVSSFEEDCAPHLRLPKRFWHDMNPVRIMAIRFTAQGYLYLFEDIPLEYTRWVAEKHIASDALGSTAADILSVLRTEMDPTLFEQLKARVAARKMTDTLLTV